MPWKNREIWFWRFVGISSLTICIFNFMVLMKGDKSSINPLENNKDSFNQYQKQKAEEDSLRRAIEEYNSNFVPSITLREGEVTPLVLKDNLRIAQGSKSAKFKNIDAQQKEQQFTAEENASSLKNEKNPDAKKIMENFTYLPFLNVQDIKSFFAPHEIMLLGKRRPKGAYLVIGIPTVKRSKAYYLLDTVESLVNGLSKSEQPEVVIVVFVADFDSEFHKKVKIDIMTRFPSEVESGLIQCIIAPQGYYPSMKNLPLLHGDSAVRVAWRSKQALDYSFLYFHCAHLGQYFLQLEDDILAEDKYLLKIKGFISSRTSKWSTLEFGARGFIGMMYKTTHLAQLAKYCRMNYFLMPVDGLLRVFNDIWLYGSENRKVHQPPIFKYIGTYSSLNGHLRKSEDVKNALHLPKAARVHKDANNPKAIVSSSIMKYVANHPVGSAYSGGSFWGVKVVVGDHIQMKFEKPVSLKRFVLISGTTTHPPDALENSEVFVSAAPRGLCDAYRSIYKAVGRKIVDTGVVNIDHPVKCIKLVINKVRKDEHGVTRWLIVSEIDVWTK